MLLPPQRRRPNITQCCTATGFLSLTWKTEVWGFEVDGIFSCNPPSMFTVPGAVCKAKVGLEMLKHNGDSVRPEGP